MEKKKQRLLLIAWLSVAVVSRILYFFLIQGAAHDTYAYYADTIVRADSVENPVLTSGLAYAYTQILSGVLGIFGTGMEVAVGFQVILQILWLGFFFFGAKYLFTEAAGYISGTVLLISPYFLFGLQTVEPVNFYMLHWSILFFLFGVFKEHTAKKGWYRNNSGELFLMLMGFYMGVLCIWNYLGFLFLPLMAYVLKKNYDALWEGLWKQKNLELEETEQLMPVGSQCFILLTGMLVGMYATLMKYTGLTGKPLPLQFYWWTDQFITFPHRCQEIAAAVMIWLIAAILAGFIGVSLLKCWMEKSKEKREYEAYQRIETVKKEEEMKEGYFTATDGREIKYIDNPLPGPKKHVKREMDFKIHDVEGTEQKPSSTVRPEAVKIPKKDDFDYHFDTETDFDFY